MCDFFTFDTFSVLLLSPHGVSKGEFADSPRWMQAISLTSSENARYLPLMMTPGGAKQIICGEGAGASGWHSSPIIRANKLKDDGRRKIEQAGSKGTIGRRSQSAPHVLRPEVCQKQRAAWMSQVCHHNQVTVGPWPRCPILGSAV